MRVLLAKPRGFCAGVDRAIQVVESALDAHGPPIYVRKEIVHNQHVVARLRERGAVFVEELDEVPEGALAILSAHGSAPEVYEAARGRKLRLLDATCPLVHKVHREVQRFVRRGYCIVLIGHAGHDEVVGTMGQAPEQTVLVETLEDAERLELPTEQPGVILTQTTLSLDDTRAITERLRERFPKLELPPSEDICYATQNRQNAVKELTAELDLLLVIGSQNSSNSMRLTDVARDRGVQAHLIEDKTALDAAWLEGVRTVGVTSGASAPDDLVRDLIAWLREQGATEVIETAAPDENVVFKLPGVVS